MNIGMFIVNVVDASIKIFKYTIWKSYSYCINNVYL